MSITCKAFFVFCKLNEQA